MKTENYTSQLGRWPQTGRHIMAQYDDHGIIVYQAYRPAIGRFAAQHEYFGGEFKLSRMSWIKPNFLWMMYRCGWGAKTDQEVVLAITLKRAAFDGILAQAVYSSFGDSGCSSHTEWQRQIAESEVRLQWDPDHDPYGNKLQRRAIQLGLSGEVLRAYAREWILMLKMFLPLRRTAARYWRRAGSMNWSCLWKISTRWKTNGLHAIWESSRCLPPWRKNDEYCGRKNQ